MTTEQVPSKERDLSEYLGKDRDELRAIIGERDAEIEQLREARHKNDRVNFETTDDGFRICRGYHHRSADCEWLYYVPRSTPEPPVVCGPELAHAMDKLGAIVNGQSERITPIEANALLINWRQLQSDARAAQPPRKDHCEVCDKELPHPDEWSMPSCPDCQEVLEFLGELEADYADRERHGRADLVGSAIKLICRHTRTAQPPGDDAARLNWWFMNVLHVGGDDDDDESGSDIEYEARLCRTPDEFRAMIDAAMGRTPTKEGEQP